MINYYDCVIIGYSQLNFISFWTTEGKWSTKYYSPYEDKWFGPDLGCIEEPELYQSIHDLRPILIQLLTETKYLRGIQAVSLTKDGDKIFTLLDWGHETNKMIKHHNQNQEKRLPTPIERLTKELCQKKTDEDSENQKI